MFFSSPSLYNPERPRRHAVDTPIGMTVIIADGDAEATVVGPDHIQVVVAVVTAVAAVDAEPGPLAGVRGQVVGVVGLLVAPGAGEVGGGLLGVVRGGGLEEGRLWHTWKKDQ